MKKMIAAVVMASVAGMSFGAYAAPPAGTGHPHKMHAKAHSSHKASRVHKTSHHKKPTPKANHKTTG